MTIVTITRDASAINIISFSKTVNGGSKSVIDNSRVLLQIVASLL
jgi:hypothetical protein